MPIPPEAEGLVEIMQKRRGWNGLSCNARALSRPALVMALWALLAWVGGATVQAVEISQAELQNRRCINCHGQQRLGELSEPERRAMVAPGTAQPTTRPNIAARRTASVGPTRPELYVTPEALSVSVHKSLACVDCHQDAASLPHVQRLTTPTCDSKCHSRPQSDFMQGAHAEAIAKGDPKAPVCATCHGGHDIRPKTDRLSRTYPLNIVKVCGDCHQQHQGQVANGESQGQFVGHYMDSVHGRAVAKGGLVVAATCADCHGPHKVLPASDAASSVSRQHIPQTCGQCHTGVSETYQTSVHGQKLMEGSKDAPVCSSCHTAHAITRTDTPAFMLDIVNECGECHDRQAAAGTMRTTSLYDTYRRSYHGQVTALGSTRAARCSDCHGAHDVLPIADPKSRLHESNRVEACRQCHPQAGVNFAQFQAHADHRDAKRYPVLHGVWLYFVVMMSASFGFFGLHSLLWLGRSIIERIKHGPRHHHNTMNPHAIQRFNRVDRINHAFVIISFFGLALTGLPLLYADKPWGKALAAMLGGVHAAGIEHRIFAIMLICNFLVHGVGIIRRIRKYSLKKLIFGPTTMLPRLKDAQDAAGMFRWFFRGGKKPAFDRWTYWEKFDYMAEVGGSGIIGLSGLMLWFPEFFSNFLPGWMFNVATIVHGYEALLAVGFIFTIHFFNAHLRLEKFPVDDVIFTGRLSEEEFKEERGAEYARLEASGELASLRVKPPHPYYRVFAVTVGVVAMAIGTTIAVLIILAGLGVV